MNAIDTNETLKSIEAIALKNGLEQDDNPETGDGFVQVPIAKQGREEEQPKSLNNRSDGPLREDAYSSKQRYRELFDDSPVAIWVDDWSSAKQMPDAIGEVDDWRTYFQQHPGRLKKAYAAVQIVEVSRATIVLFNEDSLESLLQHNDVTEVIDEELESFLDTLIDFWSHTYSSVAETIAIDGDRNEIIIRRQTVMPPAH